MSNQEGGERQKERVKEVMRQGGKEGRREGGKGKGEMNKIEYPYDIAVCVERLWVSGKSYLFYSDAHYIVI